jgi:hypothetical protein
MANGKNTSLLSGALSGATTGASVGGPYGAAIGGLLGGAAGYFGGQDDNSNDYYNQMMDRLNAINVPGIEQLTFTPEELSYLVKACSTVEAPTEPEAIINARTASLSIEGSTEKLDRKKYWNKHYV